MRITNRNARCTEEFDTRRIILLQGNPSKVLLEFDGNHRALPTLSIPRWQRVADNLVTALRSKCNIAGISTCCIKAPGDASSSLATGYEVMEPCEPSNDTPLGMDWVLVAGLTDHCFRDPSDFHALQQAVTQSARYNESTAYAPFGRLGWFEEVENWVQDQLGPLGLHLNGRFRQLNASPTFSLIRFETDGSAVWFKAVGVPNQREYPVTCTLAQMLPQFLPSMVATRPEWNAWLSLDAEGPLLDDNGCGLTTWKAVARDLAELQRHSVGRSLHLLHAGARDLRTESLFCRVDSFFEIIAELMGRQTIISPKPLTAAEVRSLSERVRDALNVLAETGFPTTLGHLDLNPGNIVAPLSGCVFLDWAEAFVGHPLLTFEYLREHFRKTFGCDSAEEAKLVSCYSFAWSELVTQKELFRAFEVSPLVAAFACAAGTDLWRNNDTIKEPKTAGYLRSLTRRMDREARALAERSAPCPS